MVGLRVKPEDIVKRLRSQAQCAHMAAAWGFAGEGYVMEQAADLIEAKLCKKRTSFPKWLVNISITINNLTGGPKGWSLCARFYQGKLDGRRGCKLLVTVTNRLFWFDPDHCQRAWKMRRSA